jgi:predicted ArsR family transcriptional regulator
VNNGDVEDNGRPKKEYELTERGRRIFEAEVARLESVVAVARESTAGARA